MDECDANYGDSYSHSSLPQNGVQADSLQPHVVPDPASDVLCHKLFALSEEFREEGNLRESMQCLQAAVEIEPSKALLAQAHTNLGALLLKYGSGSGGDATARDIAQSHLHTALQICNEVSELQMDEVRFHAAAMLAECYSFMEEYGISEDILSRALRILPENALFWRCRLLFQLAQVHYTQRNVDLCLTQLDTGLKLAKNAQSIRTEGLFEMSKAMLYVAGGNSAKAHATLVSVKSRILDQWPLSQAQRDELKVFFLSVQVLHFLSICQLKDMDSLQQLQDALKCLCQHSENEPFSSNPGDFFQWMSRETMFTLGYLLCVIHAVLSGELSRAQKYIERGLININKCKLVDKCLSPFFRKLTVFFYEHRTSCYIIAGSKTKAMKTIVEMCRVLCKSTQLMHSFEAQTHTLLGMYSMSLGYFDHAEKQFNTALRVTKENDTWLLNNMNLAIVYLRTGKETDFYALLDRFAPERLTTQEALRESTEEQLNRLTCCSLVLLGHIFSSESNCKESMEMVTPALKIAKKTPDLHVQIWACALMKDLYRLNGANEDATRMQNQLQELLTSLKTDQYAATTAHEHLIMMNWTDNECPLRIVNAGDGL